MNLIVKSALADRIIGILRERIVAGAIPPEAPIRQDALAAELGVSKIPLREAFAKLEQDGLVVSRLNRGYFVCPLSPEEARDVFELRLKIEPDAVAAAARRRTRADIDGARRILATLNASVNVSLGALNRAFHMALIRPCGWPVTMQLAERLQIAAERYVIRHLKPTGRCERAVGEHADLFGAWASGDARRAAELSAAHIARTRDDLGVELQRARDLVYVVEPM
jgi:DNA-binding GntR family transcriptional regulator